MPAYHIPQLKNFTEVILLFSQLILDVTIHYSDMDSDESTPVIDTATQGLKTMQVISMVELD